MTTCSKCSSPAVVRGFCNRCYGQLYRLGQIQIKKPRTSLERRLHRTLANIKLRCNYPGTNGFYRYGGRGITTALTIDDLRFLWFRDNAQELKEPSIDRVDSNGNYTVENCRWIERRQNSSARPPLQCRECHLPERRMYQRLCSQCRAKGLRVCARCGIVAIFTSQHCIQCRPPVVTSCTWCKGQIVRKKSDPRNRNSQSFCNRLCYGKWLGTHYGNGRPK